MALGDMALWLQARQAAAATLPQQSLDLSTYPSTPLQNFGLALLILFPVISVLMVGLRLYWRFSTKAIGVDDVFITAATICAAAEAAVSFYMVKLMYIGVHVWQLPTEPYDPTLGNIFNYVVVVFYNPQLGLVKSSVLFFLLRLGGQHQRGLRRTIQWLNWSNIALMIAVLFASIFTCVPVNKYWNRSLDGVCNNEAYQYLITSSITVLTDILVLAIPFYLVGGLQMPRKLKIGLIAVLCAGVIVTVFSILRLRMLVSLYYEVPEGDWSYNIGFVYSTVECNLAIISASVPALHGLFKKWAPTIFKTSTGSTEKRDRPTYAGGYGHSSHTYGAGRSTVGVKSMNGTSIGLKEFKNGHSRLNSLTNSEEEILGPDRDRITRTTQVEVTFENRH